MSQSPEAPPAIDLQNLFAINRIIANASDWKQALEEIARLLRTFFIFDNMVVYLADPENRNLDVAYARALGRGKRAEADVAWGEIFAYKISNAQQTLLEEPQPDTDKDRLKKPYLLGAPILFNQRNLGAVVFIRFGGPAFTSEAVQMAEYLSQQLALLIERQRLLREYQLLEEQYQQVRLHEDFLSTISHELRNPLGFIKGYTTTLLRTDASWDYPTQLEFLQIIDRETDNLQELIDNLLDSARLQAGQMHMHFQPCRLDAVLRDVIARAKMSHPTLVIHLQVPDELKPIKGDPQRLAQVFENLISNTVKYAPKSDMWISIDQDENGVHILVSDQGPGISEKFLPFIFDRFFRNPEQPPNTHGSGLGLYICKQIIQAHKGQISASSTLGEGTIFHIYLPSQP